MRRAPAIQSSACWVALLGIAPSLCGGELSPGHATALSRATLGVVKVYGAGRIAGLEGYQTGLFLDAPEGVLTVDSTVLERDSVTVVDAYGERYEARVASRDPASGLALLSLPEGVSPPEVFGTSAVTPPVASPLWVLSNCFSIAMGAERVSVQSARLAASAPVRGALQASQGAPPAGVPLVHSEVLLLDAVTSNPGAAGGAVVTLDGDLVGMIGAELRDRVSGAWINYAIPIDEVRNAIDRMTGPARPMSGEVESERLALSFRKLTAWGAVLIPRVNPRTPAFVEYITSGSPAAEAGMRVDDLIVAVDDHAIGTIEEAAQRMHQAIDSRRTTRLTVFRDAALVTLRFPEPTP